MSQSPRALSAQASPLTFYTLHNYSGTPTPVSHGQTGIIASSVTAWAQLSLSVGAGSLRAWIWSSVNTGDPAQSYTGHAESYVSANISELDHAYSSPQFPLQYLGLDSALASPVIVAFSGTFSGPDAFAATALVPGGTSQTTFASASTPGALGFVGTTAGQSTFVNLLTGTQNADGTVAWSGSGSLTLVWDGAQLQVTGATGLPDSWTFATPVRQADGSWQVSLTEGAVTHTGTLYTQANYTGSSQTLKAHQFLTVNSGAGWTALSARLSELPVLLYASFNALDVSYHYSTYQLLRLTQDTPDFSVPFTGNTPVQMLVTDPGDVQVNVQVGTTGTSDAVLVMSQAYPQPFSTAATRSVPGLLALVPAAGTPQTIAVQYGSLNGDGTASLTGSGTLTVSLNGATPVVTPGTGIPAEWVFGTPVPQPDGSWQVALSDVPVTGSLTLYPQKNYEGTPVAQNEHQVATLRTLAYHWTYDSVKVNGERFLSHTVYDPQDVNYDWQRYRDNYRAEDIADISLDYELAGPLIQGVTLGENDVVVQVLVIPQDTDVPVVLSATQVWPELYATASVTNGLQTHEGVMVVFDRSTPVKVPLQVGTLDEAGHVSWQGSTSVTAGWDETAQRPVLVLDPDTTPEDWQLWPLNATDQPGLWRTELSVSMTVKMQYSSNAPAGMFGNIYPTNKITFYGSPMQTVSASLDSPTAYFISNEMTTASVTLDSSGYGLLEVYNSQPETITVTASSAVLPQTIDMTFTKVDSALWTFCNINTPADGKTPGTVYYIDRQTGSEALNMSLSGSATFSDGQSTGSFSVSSTYAAVNIYDNIAETVTVTMYTANHDVPDDQINFVSVIANDSNK